MTSVYNNTYDLFNGLNRPWGTIPILTMGGTGFLVYTVELLLITVWFLVHQGDRLFCCYPGWYLEARGKPVGKSMLTVHILMLTGIIGCLYKLASSAIMVGEQATQTIGPEFVCFIFVDLCWYDVSFAALLIILLKVLTTQWCYGREDMTTVTRIIVALRVIIVASAALSMANAVFTTLALTLSPTSEILGPMLYAVTFPILVGVKALFTIMAIVFGSILIWINRQSVNADTSLQSVTVAVSCEAKDWAQSGASKELDEYSRDITSSGSDGPVSPSVGTVSKYKQRTGKRWSETLKKNRALGLRVSIMMVVVMVSHFGIVCMIPVAYFFGAVPLVALYLLPGALLNLLLLLLFVPERAKWKHTALALGLAEKQAAAA